MPNTRSSRRHQTHHPLPPNRAARAWGARRAPQAESEKRFRKLQDGVLMRYNQALHHRRSIRLPRHDYTRGGVYFVTICTHGRQRFFGEIRQGRMCLCEAGLVVQNEWSRMPSIRKEIRLDAFVVMPDHLHGIVVFTNNEPVESHLPCPARSLGAFVAGFKASTTKMLRPILDLPPGESVWQRNYHERIIPNQQVLIRVRAYIEANPARWQHDHEN